jgi:hypothetical protein
MSASDLLPAVEALPRAEQLKLVHAIIDSLAVPAPAALIPDGEYSIWSPRDSYEAAEVLMKLLEDTAESR